MHQCARMAHWYGGRTFESCLWHVMYILFKCSGYTVTPPNCDLKSPLIYCHCDRKSPLIYWHMDTIIHGHTNDGHTGRGRYINVPIMKTHLRFIWILPLRKWKCATWQELCLPNGVRNISKKFNESNNIILSAGDKLAVAGIRQDVPTFVQYFDNYGLSFEGQEQIRITTYLIVIYKTMLCL